MLYRCLCGLLFGLGWAVASRGFCQANLPLYTEQLINGFQNWSWGTVNLADTSQAHSGTRSASFTGTAFNVAFSPYHPTFNPSPYASFSFWAHGGASGGQVLRVYAHVNGADGP